MTCHLNLRQPAVRIVLGAFYGEKLVNKVTFDKESAIPAMKSLLEDNFPGCVVKRAVGEDAA